MEKRLITTGRDYTRVMPVFRDLIVRSGIREGENLLFAGCPGACYSMATLLGFGLRDLDLNLFFAVDADIRQLWRLEQSQDLGVRAAGKAEPIKGRVIVIMSGLCTLPIEKATDFIEKSLGSEGVLVGEAPAPDFFEERGWIGKIPFHYLFEFSMENPTSYDLL
jgi:hypothetical protein